MNLNENAPTATTPRNPYHWFVFLGIELTSRCRRAAPISHIQLDHGVIGTLARSMTSPNTLRNSDPEPVMSRDADSG